MIGDPRAAQAQVERLAKSSPAVVRLAELASLASRIETGLLRELRLRLVPGADAGTEADLWFGSLVATRDSTGIALRTEMAEVLRQRLATDEASCTAARAIVARRHGGTNPAQELEERLTFLALQPPGKATDATIDDELRTAVKAMVGEPSRTRDLASWAVRAVPRLPPRVRDTTAAWTLGLTAAAHLDGRPVLEGKPPDGALDDLQSLLPSRPGVPVGIRSVVGGLELSLPPDPRAEVIQAAPTDPVLVDVQVADGTIRTESIRRGRVVTIEGVGRSSVRVTAADGSGVSLELPRPDIVLLVGEDLARAATSAPTGRAIDRPDVIESPLRSRTRELKDIEEQVRSWRGRMPETGEALRIGELVGRLLPEPFWGAVREAFSRSDGRAPSVLLLTDRGDIPWELAIGSELPSIGRYPCLGMVADLGIWLLPQGSGGPDEPLPLAVHCGTIVAAAVGDQALPNLPRLLYAQGEAKRLQETRGAVTIQPTADELYPWLEGRFPCDILHVASQGGLNPERDRTVIGLADGGFFDARSDVRISLQGTVVVLNSPNAADPALVDRLLVGGAGAVIAPRWTVTDQVAQDFIGVFYDAAFDGNFALGGALREARQRSAASTESDATPLAYALYGHPATVLKWQPGAIAWNLSGERPLGRPLIGHTGPITAVAWSPDGQRIVTAGKDEVLLEWDARTGRLLDTWDAPRAIGSIAVSPDGSRLATGGPDTEARVWIHGIPDPRWVSRSGSEPSEVAWSPDGTQVAWTGDADLVIADRDGTSDLPVRLLTGPITKVAWWAPGRIVTGSLLGTIAVVSTVRREKEREFQDDREPITALAVAAERSRVATVAGSSITLYDLATGAVRLKLPINESVLAMTATPTGFRMITPSGQILDWHEGGDAPPSEVARIAPAAMAAFGPGGASVVTVAGSAAPEPEPQAQYAS